MIAIMNYKNIGELELSRADDANIPVNCFISPPDDWDEDFDDLEAKGKWQWRADNFMPRKSAVVGEAYRIAADTREDIVAAVQKHVVPLYSAAIENLENDGTNYYWG